MVSAYPDQLSRRLRLKLYVGNYFYVTAPLHSCSSFLQSYGHTIQANFEFKRHLSLFVLVLAIHDIELYKIVQHT